MVHPIRGPSHDLRCHFVIILYIEEVWLDMNLTFLRYHYVIMMSLLRIILNLGTLELIKHENYLGLDILIKVRIEKKGEHPNLGSIGLGTLRLLLPLSIYQVRKLTYSYEVILLIEIFEKIHFHLVRTLDSELPSHLKLNVLKILILSIQYQNMLELDGVLNFFVLYIKEFSPRIILGPFVFYSSHAPFSTKVIQ